jgi:hypothetical protein
VSSDHDEDLFYQTEQSMAGQAMNISVAERSANIDLARRRNSQERDCSPDAHNEMQRRT